MVDKLRAEVKSDYIWSYIGTLLNIGVNILMLPFVLAHLTDDELGMWYVFQSLNALVALLDFGFNATVARNVNYAWNGADAIVAEGTTSDGGTGTVNDVLFYRVTRVCRRIYLVIALCALLLMVSLGTLYVDAVSPDGNIIWFISWGVYALGIFFNLYYGYLEACLRGVGAITANYKSISISKMVQFAVTVATLLSGAGLFGTAVAFFVSNFVLRMLLMRGFSRYDGVAAALRAGEECSDVEPLRPLFSSMWHNAWRDGLVSLSAYLSTQANTVICSLVLGLASTGSYGLAIQITTVVSNCAYSWYNAAMPKIQSRVLLGDKYGAARYLSQSLVAYLGVSVIGYVAFIVIGIPLIRVFKTGFDFDLIMLVTICAYMLVYRGINLFASFISCFNVIPYMPAFVVTSIVSVVASFLLANFTDIGLWCLIFPPLTVNLAYNFWKWPMEACRLANVKIVDLITLSFVKARA